jgi:hypothetical protein
MFLIKAKTMVKKQIYSTVQCADGNMSSVQVTAYCESDQSFVIYFYLKTY